jgi:hypothetical protein
MMILSKTIVNILVTWFVPYMVVFIKNYEYIVFFAIFSIIARFLAHIILKNHFFVLNQKD